MGIYVYSHKIYAGLILTSIFFCILNFSSFFYIRIHSGCHSIQAQVLSIHAREEPYPTPPAMCSLKYHLCMQDLIRFRSSTTLPTLLEFYHLLFPHE